METVFAFSISTAQSETEALHADPTTRLLIRVLEELNSSGCVYALLHGDSNRWPDADSDVDIAFEAPPPSVLEPILARLQAAGLVTLVQRLHYEVPHGYYYMLQVPGPRTQFLHLDCLFDPSGINRYRLPTSYLLEGATQGAYGRRTSAHKQAIYLLMKRAIKGRLDETQFAHLRGVLEAAPAELWPDVERWFGTAGKREAQQLALAQDASAARAHLQRMAAAADRVFLLRHPLLACRRFFASWRRKLARLRQPTGLFVCIVGPDGAGKSTVTSLLLERLERAYRRTWRFHWRPGLLPKLGRGGKEAAPTSNAPANVSKYRGVVSLARFLYYWLDFVLGYWLIIYPRKAQTTLVVGERYFPDVLVHPERYGFAVPRWLLREAARWVRAPDLLIVLKDRPEVIYARKPELPVEVIAQQLLAYEEEAGYWGARQVLETTPGAQSVAARIAQAILAESAHRTHLRLHPPAAAQRWRAFPSVRNAKLWVNDRDSLRNALHLYHPYSSFGRLAKVAGERLPAAMRALLFRAHPDHAWAQRMTRLTRIIRATLRDEQLTVSYYMGTPGPHQKMTAQVSRDGEVVSYVKIGDNEAICKLLTGEADLLAWLRQMDFRAAVLPSLQALEHLDHDTLLFVSPPPQAAGRQRAYAWDYDDVRFLLALDAVAPSTLPVESVFARMQLQTYLDRIASDHPAIAALLRDVMESIRQALSATGVRTSVCHGDFAPWNTLEVHDGRMFVFDWEYAQRQGVALSDWCHCLFSPPRLVTHQSPAAAVGHVMQAAELYPLKLLLQQTGITTELLPTYVALYLLEQLAVRPNALSTPDPYLVEALEHVRSHMSPRRPKVLVAAYACEPDSGSEPGVGWHMCQAISREHEAWVVTRSNNRRSIEHACALQPNPNLHFVYADLPSWARFWKRGERGIHLYYYLWQFAAWRTARRLAREVPFDLAHHVTFVNDYTFSFLGLLKLPFVWGPIGSNGKRHAALMPGAKAVLKDRAQYYLKSFRRSLDPLVWLCAKRASLVIGNHAAVAERVPLSTLAQGKYLTHIAIGVEQLADEAPARSDQLDFSVLSVGNLLPIKGFDLSISAFAELLSAVPAATLTIVGDGPLRASLEALARELGIQDRVIFTGRLPREAVQKQMQRADAFLFPSAEVAGMVTLEAMAHGVPVVGLQGTGVGEMVPPQCGFAIAQGRREDTVQALANCLARLAQDRQLHAQMRQACRRVTSDRYAWEHRHEAIRSWYHAAGLRVSMPVVPVVGGAT